MRVPTLQERGLKLYRVEVWIGPAEDAGEFMGQPSLVIEAMAARTASEAERRARDSAARMVRERPGFVVVAEAMEVE